MDKKENNMKFKKKAMSHSNNSYYTQNQREALKTKIIEKYDVSPIEADKILTKLQKKQINNVTRKSSSKKLNSNAHKLNESKISKQVLKRKNGSHVIRSPQGNGGDKTDVINKKHVRNQPISKIHEENQNYSKELEKKDSLLIDENEHNKIKNVVVNPKNNFEKDQNNMPHKQTINQKFSNQEDILHKGENVDSILEDIIPNYNKQISIDVDHVDLTFEVENEKVDTLKETFIRTLKRNNPKKMKIHALKDISFKIYKGEKVGIIGYNGAGKSTLLNVISGIYPPDKGKVTTYGNISPLLSLGAGFDQNFSGRKNIILNGAILGYDRDFLESKIDEIIEFSELGEFIDIPIKNYSSGMLAKLGFSIATSVNPDILIIDEILAVGDVTFKKKSTDKIKSLMGGGTTVLLVSHSIPQIRELCDKAIWIDNGVLKDIGEVNKVCDEYLKDAQKASNEQLANIKLVN